MEIGSVIREKRTAQGLTQEQVATALGVSAPAVSKWERGESFPEITLLPALARLLGTDLNGLLSFQQEMGREEIAAFLGRLVQAAEEGPQAAFALARAQVGQFPRCDSLALNVALTLEGVLTMAGREGSAEEREWIQALYRQAAESRDQAVACQAQAMLFGRAMEEGDFAQAEALLDRLPPQPLYDRAQMEARLAQAKGDGDRAGQLLEHQLLQQASGAQTTLLALLELAGREGRRGDLAPLADKAVALGQLLELAPYGGWSVRLQQACLTRDTDAALAALDMMDFEGIEKVRQRVSENGTLYQQLQQMAQQMQKMAAIIDQQNGTNVSEAAGAAAQAAGSTGGGSGSSNVTRSTTNSLGAAVGEGNNSLSTQAAKRAMDANNPNKE